MAKPDSRTAERRLLKLAAWFLAHGPATRAQVYVEFSKDYTGDAQAREKKWTRDKRDLERLGVPLRYTDDEGGKYRLEPGSFYLPQLSFAPAEAAVLSTAARAALRDGDHPLHDDLEAALRKLVVGTSGLPPRAADVERVREGATPPAVRRWLEKIEDALEPEDDVEKKVLRISYWVPSRDEVTERDVSPYGYAWRRGEWLLVGHCHVRKAIRVFYVRRIRSLKLAPKGKKDRADQVSYVKPPADFDIRRWSRQEPWDYLAHDPLEAVVRFRGSLAKIAPKLVPGAKLSTAPENARIARLVVRDLNGLVRQCLAWGPEAEIVAPEAARERARTMLQAIGVVGGAA
jgi:predicted DNA-binding transcriptional regulator YafY